MDLQSSAPAAPQHALSLEQLSYRRTAALQNLFREKHGSMILNGPMRGMHFLEQAVEGCYLPKLLGIYEQPLHPHLEAAITRGYGRLLNIGSAEGLYAVGFACRVKTLRVEAFDINPRAAEACRELAQRNGVADRVHAHGAFQGFEKYAGERVLVICDIEGAELDLLHPHHTQALKSMDVIVEAHECFRQGIVQELAQRFEPSHDLVLVTDDGMRTIERSPEWFKALRHLDQILCTWEWRAGPTPWLVMRAKA